MVNIERFLQEKQTVEKILEELGKLCNLPNYGMLAGGSVANTILSMIDKKKYPINDIDIFCDNLEKAFSNDFIKQCKSNNINVTRETGIFAFGHSHYHEIRLEPGYGYAIKKYWKMAL